MKDINDTQTVDVFPILKKRGRPKNPNALTNAQRQARHRQKKPNTPFFSLRDLTEC